MQRVEVDRTKLLDILRTNRDEHRNLFEKALSIYQERLLKHLERRIEEVKKGQKIDHYIRMPVPEDHTSDYDRVIKMVEMSLSDEIELTAADFSQYVMDDWSWKESFASNTTSYLTSAP